MASFMLCPFLLNERCCDCLDLTSMVERVDAGEEEPTHIFAAVKRR